MRSDFPGPVNIGSDEMISVNDLARLIIEIAGKSLDIRHVDGPQGVRGRNSDNELIESRLGWRPTTPLREGLVATYAWISEQVRAAKDPVQQPA
jgi:GDP-D-mannose 3',5'-epimerase